MQPGYASWAALAVIIAAPLWLASPAAAQCGAAPRQPKIEVRSDIQAPILDTSLGIRDITANPNLAVPRGLGDGYYAIGATGLNIAHQLQFSAIGEPRAEVGYCWSVREAVLTITAETKVHVAAEVPRDSCVWHEVMDHEKKHVKLDRDLFPQLVAAMRAEVARVIGQSVPGATDEVAGLIYRTQMQAALEAVAQRYSAGRKERQLAIDTPEEYARFARACGSAVLAEILARAGIQ